MTEIVNFSSEYLSVVLKGFRLYFSSIVLLHNDYFYNLYNLYFCNIYLSQGSPKNEYDKRIKTNKT